MYLNRRFYIAVTIVVCCFVAGYASVFIFSLAQLLLLLLLALCVYDFAQLWRGKKRMTAYRACSDRFSNGDENEIRLHISNHYTFPVSVRIIDEVPVIFQLRDFYFDVKLNTKEDKTLTYTLRPVKRGVYKFGITNLFVSTRIGLLSRRFKSGATCEVKVYPSYLCLRQYELMAISNRLTDNGRKRIRKIGQQLEPDQIKDYVQGDDYRTINWKATARRHKLMTNVFQEERAQNVYCLIDKGRPMQSAFEGMTLLDHAINASLALAYVSMIKGDRTGLATFEKTPDTFLPASRQPGQMQQLLEKLYAQTTTFAETDFSALYQHITKNVNSRSLLLVFTDFDSVTAIQRQLTYLSMMAKRHTVIVIFFENTELKEMETRPPKTKEECYEQVIVEKLSYEKSAIVEQLRKHNILSIYTHPSRLTPEVINKYLEIKARGIN